MKIFSNIAAAFRRRSERKVAVLAQARREHEVADWNAAVDRRKAQKHLRKRARVLTNKWADGVVDTLFEHLKSGPKRL